MSKLWHFLKKALEVSRAKTIAALCVVVFLVGSGGFALWAATLKIPDIESFDRSLLSESTKIYDKTGQIMLYNVNQDVKRTVVPFDQISPFLKQASVAIEDADFYNHGGIKLSSILRAIWADIASGSLSQGGSTITQQVVKNSLLTKDKKFSRKIKEWVLSLRLERVATKDEILNLYLNGSPYGGNLYGVEEATETFFGKSARDVTLAEAAYLAALPQAPSYYSPFGRHLTELEARKNLVLKRMKDLGMITEDEFTKAKTEKVTFSKASNTSIKAPHFVEFVRSYLEDKYGEEMVLNGGLKVTTTLDYDLEKKAEDIVNKWALRNSKTYNASNASLVAIDPTTGGILVMVGSRDYFDPKIDGNFNVALAHRQPGSSFKPFVYSTLFNKGYTTETLLFDAPTEFSTACSPTDDPNINKNCYRPGNYDEVFKGPVTVRSALAESRNVPAVEALYLAGIDDSLQTAKDMGIEELGSKSQYGLSLVLGGGEVALLDMTSAYSVFANDGVRNPYFSVLKVEGRDGNILEEYKPNPTRVLSQQTSRQLTDILSDNVARAPEFPPPSPLTFEDRPVADKTGTTNDFRDAWILGYTPQITVGAWAGNNDNTPMQKKIAGFIVAPMWREFMDEALKDMPVVYFPQPDPIDPSIKPILRGKMGGSSYFIDTSTGLLATDQTPPELRKEIVVPTYHSILYWVNKNDPLGPPPANPYSDPQFSHWEYAVQAWAASRGAQNVLQVPPPTATDNVHITGEPDFTLLTPGSGQIFGPTDTINVNIQYRGKNQFLKIDYYVNGNFVNTSQYPQFTFQISSASSVTDQNTLRVVVYDVFQNKNERTIDFGVR